MATAKRPESGEDELAAIPTGRATIQDRIAAFVMLDGMKEKTQAEKSMRLRLVGFSNAEIAVLLQTSAATVAQNLYSERKKVVKKQGAKKWTEDTDA